MSEFEKKYITSNNRKDLPEYDEAFVAKLRERILTRSPELRGISEPLLVGHFGSCWCTRSQGD